MDQVKYHIENIALLYEGDPGWDEKFENKLVTGSNIDPENEHYDEEKPPYWAELHVGRNIDIVELREDTALGMGAPPRRMMGHYSVHEAKDFCTAYIETPNEPVCKNLIVSLKNPDPALELYDRPFTMLPLRDSCISRDLGGSAKKPTDCGYSNYGNFSECSAYEPFEEVTIGKIDNTEVKLMRMYKGNVYQYCDKTFETYREIKNYCKDNNLQFELTYNPIQKTNVEFFPNVVKRLERTYAGQNRE